MSDPRLDELISLYFRLRAAGTPADPADLARPYPELLPELVRHIAALAQFREPASFDTHTLPHAPPLQPVPPSPPGYEILGELGRGGMGVVYKARQVALQRIVALKMIVSGHYASPDLLARFQTEMLAIARLSHPAIVQIFEVGSFDGRPFYSFELCANSLDRRLGGTPLPGRDAAALVRTLTDGLRAIHAANVVHRDLKPANVLLTDDGRPKITDFGLAKRLDMSDHTPAEAAVGTPGYMAPEQVGSAAAVGPPADIYSLGAILYECLTGRPPFKGETTADTLMQVVNDEPVPPRRLNSKVPRDLETICLKCLHKTPERRYPNAATLADDLGRFLDGKPILARPVSTVERAWKAMRRHPGVSTLAALIAAGTVGGLIIISVLYANAVAHANRADKNAARADELARQAQADRDRAQLRARTVEYAYTLDQARDRIDSGRYEQARQLLDDCPPALRSWEHSHLHLRLIEGYASERGHPAEAAESLALDRRGRLLTAGSRDGSVHLWDHKARRLLRSIKHSLDPVRAVALSPDGTHLVAVSWATTGGNLPSDENPATARVYDAEGRPTDADLGKLVTAVAFSPDGTRLVVGGADRVLRVFDFPALTLPRTINIPRPVTALAFHPPRGQRLAVAAGSDVYLVHLDDDRDVPRVLRHQGDVRGMAFSSDGRYLACIDGTTNKVVVHDLASRTRKPREFSDGEREVLAVAFHRARPLLAYGHTEDGYHVVDLVEPDRPYPRFPAAHSAARAAVFLPDGTLAGAAKDGVVLFDPHKPAAAHVLSPPPSPGTRLLLAHPRRPQPYAPLEHGEVVVFQGDGEFEVTGRQSGLPLARFRVAAVSPDGATRAEPPDHDPTAIRLFDAATGKPRETLRGHRTRVLSVAFSPDGGRLFSAALGEVKVWCTRTGIGLLTLKTDVPTPIRHLGLDEGAGCLVCLGDRIDLFASTPPAAADDTRLSLLCLVRAEDAKEWTEAIELIDRLTKLRPDCDRALERRRLRALAQSGREAELLAALVAGTQRRTDEDTLRWWLDDERELGPDPEETLPLIEGALDRTPDSWPLRALRGWMWRQLGHPAVADLTAAARQSGGRPDLLALAAEAELERGGEEQAAALLAAMRRTAPEPLARWHAQRYPGATPRRAVWHLTQLLAAAPGDADLHAQLGATLARIGRFREAADHFGRAADRGHGLLTRCWQGEALLAAGDVAGYRRVCAALLRQRRDEDDIPAVVWLCLLGSDAVGDPDRLVRLIEVPRRRPEPQPELDPEAIEVVMAREPAYPLLLAAALLRADRPREALRQLDRLGARDRTANWLRMIAHRRTGQTALAARIEALSSPGSVIPRLGLLAGPLALPADLTPYYHWDDWRDVLPRPSPNDLLIAPE